MGGGWWEVEAAFTQQDRKSVSRKKEIEGRFCSMFCMFLSRSLGDLPITRRLGTSTVVTVQLSFAPTLLPHFLILSLTSPNKLPAPQLSPEVLRMQPFHGHKHSEEITRMGSNLLPAQSPPGPHATPAAALQVGPLNIHAKMECGGQDVDCEWASVKGRAEQDWGPV